jgi:hypothetical protein
MKSPRLRLVGYSIHENRGLLSLFALGQKKLWDGPASPPSKCMLAFHYIRALARTMPHTHHPPCGLLFHGVRHQPVPCMEPGAAPVDTRVKGSEVEACGPAVAEARHLRCTADH